MKKFCPAITIWSIDIRDRDTGVIIHQIFFLFYNRAKKYFENCLEWVDRNYFDVSLGGERLLLW